MEILSESYLEGKAVQVGVEYEPDKLICCVPREDSLYFIERSPIKRLPKKLATEKSVLFELIPLKVKGKQGRTLVLLRDDFAVRLIIPSQMKIKKVIDAPYAGCDSNKIYKTVDVVVRENKDVDVFYLQKEDDKP